MISNQRKLNVKWLSSNEARKKLRVSTCHLMHLREAGALSFEKRGNAFMYAADDVKRNKSHAKSRRDPNR